MSYFFIKRKFELCDLEEIFLITQFKNKNNLIYTIHKKKLSKIDLWMYNLKKKNLLPDYII